MTMTCGPRCSSYLAANAKVDEIQCIYLHEVLQDLLTVATDAVATLEELVEIVPIRAMSSKMKGRGEGTSQSEVQAKPWASAFWLRYAECPHVISPFAC